MSDHEHPDFDDLLRGLFGGPPKGNLCYCGSTLEAVDAARKLIVQLTASDCPVWALQVTIAMSVLSQMAFKNEAPPPAQLKYVAAAMKDAVEKSGINRVVLLDQIGKEEERIHGHRR